MEHIILTRFYCFDFKWSGLNIFSNKLLEDGLTMMRKFLIPSLENQNDKNFTHIVLINDKHTKDYHAIKQLYELNPNYNLRILTVSESNEFLKNIKDKHVILSRIDSDDAIYFDAVKDTKQNFDNNEFLKFYGYRNGLTFIVENNKCYFINTLYHGGGTNSQFQSLMFNDFQNYHGSFGYDHSNVFAFFKNNKIEITKTNYIINEKVMNAYLWVMHNFNAHYKSQNHSKQFSNKLITFKPNEFKQRFGVSL